MKVLVTGGAGFIGSHIVDELLASNDYELVIVDQLITGSQSNVPKGLTFYHADITNLNEMDTIFKTERPSYVIHQAAQVDVPTSIQHPFFDAYTNILGTISLLMNCQKYNVNKFIYASSCAIYGDVPSSSIYEDREAAPLSFYGVSKYTPEQYIMLFHSLYGLSYTILRYANVYGPRQSIKAEGGVVAIFINDLLNGKSPQIFGDGQQTRDFIFVKDVAKANVLALHKGDNQVINIGSNKQTSINELYKQITLLLPSSPPPIYRSVREGDIRHSQLDNLKAQQLLSWSPKYSLERGLFETVAYYQGK